jgi:hypothetical protein
MIHKHFVRITQMVVCMLAGFFIISTAPAQTFSLDALTAGANGVAPDDLLLAPGGAPLLGGATGLAPPPPPGFPLPPVDVDAISFGHVFPAGHSLVGAEFSVAPGSVGAAGTALSAESGGVGFLDEPADIYISGMGGLNALGWDGDGVPAPGVPLLGPMGVFEPGSNVDAWDATPPFGPAPIGPGIHFTVTAFEAATHPIYTGTGATGSYIFFSPPVVGYSVLPALFATDASLGLLFLDDIDALVIVDDGSGGPSPGDTIYFSLTPISPTLGLLGASPADILVTSIGGAPSIAVTAASLGMLAGDDMDALDLVIIPEPASAALMCLAGVWMCGRRRG